MWTVRAGFAWAALAASLALGALVAGSVLSWKHRAEIAELKELHREQMLKGWETAHKVNEKVTERYHEDIATIATRPPGRTVLVCPAQAPSGAVLPGAAAGAGAEAPSGLQGAAGGEAGRDLGPFLAAESDRADRCAAQLNSLIDWIETVRTPK